MNGVELWAPNWYPGRHQKSRGKRLEMADNWGKLILGVLAGAAIWKGIGPNGQQQVTDTLNTCAAEFHRIKQEEERQKSLALLLQAVKDLPMEPRPVLPPIDLPVLPIPAAHPIMAGFVETGARWWEVLVAPAVFLLTLE